MSGQADTRSKTSARDLPCITGNPFKFLDYYTENPSDIQRFAGRSREVQDIVAQIVRDKTFVLYGRSGLGKTSLIRAGAFPELERRGYRSVYVRTLEDPIIDVVRAVQSAVPNGHTAPAGDVVRAIETCAIDRPLVIVLDQFEEFFIRFRDMTERRDEFIRLVTSIASRADINVRVVFSLREDYLAALDDFRSGFADLFTNAYRVMPLTAFGARQAILQAFTVSGVTYERSLLVSLVDILAKEGFDPPLLQIICSELFDTAIERDPTQPCLTMADLRTIGDLEQIFRRYLEGALSQIPSEQYLLVRLILDELITQDQTKNAVTLDNFLSVDFNNTADETQTVLEVLAANRIVRKEQRGKHIWYELIHERLIPSLLSWMELDRDFYQYRVARNVATTMARAGTDALLNRNQVDKLIGGYKTRLRFDDHVEEFLLRSSIVGNCVDAPYWAQRVGLRKSDKIWHEYATNARSELRRAAAEVAAQFPDPNGQVAETCMAIALSDDADSTRRAAGQSLKEIIGEKHLPILAAALRQRSRIARRRAIELLADLL